MVRFIIWLTLLAGLAHPAVASQKLTTEELWQAYLQPQAQWPELPDQVTADLAPLPDPQPLLAQLDDDLVALGNKLFHDTRLSSTGEIACASCHLADHAFADPRASSVGVHQQKGKRNAPALMNAHLWTTFFWDGRAPTLEAQAAMPVMDPLEMAHEPAVIARMVATSNDYAPFIEKVTDNTETVEWSLLASALAEFQRTLMDDPKQQSLDRFLLAINNQQWQQARSNLSDQELLGLHLFRTKAGCIKCHNGALLSDQQFHKTGLHYYGRHFEDLGRFEITGKLDDMGAFRTPSLRHLMASKPWMHNGLFDQLEGIVRMYEHGGARPSRPKNLPLVQYYPTTTDRLVAFRLTDEERDALLAFLKQL